VPLILDPDAYSEQVLSTLVTEFANGLAEMRHGLEDPARAVLDESSMVTARELIDAALARINDSGRVTRVTQAANVNLGYATMNAVIDLVKSHTEGPIVPTRGKPRGAPLLRHTPTRPSPSSPAGSAGSARARSRSGAPSRTRPGTP
jgi:hypothetical protein